MGSIPLSEGSLDVKLISVLSNLGAVVGGDAVSGRPVVTPERTSKWTFQNQSAGIHIG